MFCYEKELCNLRFGPRVLLKLASVIEIHIDKEVSQQSQQQVFLAIVTDFNFTNVEQNRM